MSDAAGWRFFVPLDFPVSDDGTSLAPRHVTPFDDNGSYKSGGAGYGVTGIEQIAPNPKSMPDAYRAKGPKLSNSEARHGRVDRLCALVVATLKQVRVDSQGHRRVGMAKPLADLDHVDAGVDQHRRVRMPQCMPGH